MSEEWSGLQSSEKKFGRLIIGDDDVLGRDKGRTRSMIEIYLPEKSIRDSTKAIQIMITPEMST